MSLPQSPRAVVTGAGSGLGRAITLEIVRRGGRVLAADINDEGVRETARLAEQAGGVVTTARCDVSKSAEVEALVGEADRSMDGVDLLVNNAGVAVAGPMEEIPLADWEWIMGINLWGVVYGCRAFIPRFKAQGGGHILNVASAAGIISAPEAAPYNVTKAGVVALSETLAVELEPSHIGVTVLCPTFFKTAINEKGRSHGRTEAVRRRVDKMMRRAGVQADGVARVALDAVAKGALYALPHRDGRWMWRLKRASPELFQGSLVGLLARRFRRAGGGAD